MKRLRVSEVEAAIAAGIIMIFCVLTFAATLVLACTGTKIYLGYVCAAAAKVESSDHYPHHFIINRACNIIGLEDGPTSETFIGFQLSHPDPTRSFISFLSGWMLFLVTVVLNLPQWTTARDLFHAILFAKTDRNRVEKTLIATWRHQSVQNFMIFVEFLTTLVMSIFILVVPSNAHSSLMEWIVMKYFSKVLLGRVICAFFVEIYFHEQLLVALYTGEKLKLPHEFKRLLEQTFGLSNSEEKNQSKHEKPLPI